MQKNIKIYSKDDFDGMRKSGSLASQVLKFIEPKIVEGITTNEINDLCHEFIIANGAIPAPLNYHGFPKSICTSINEVVCHGIPSDRKLKSGDIINIDVTVILNGWYGDTSKMFYVESDTRNKNDKQNNRQNEKKNEKLKAEKLKIEKLINTTYDALMRSIEIVKPGVKINQIGKCIQSFVEKQGFSVVRDYCGHGIGKNFHEDPQVLHYWSSELDITLEEGMFFTIEPMINAGKFNVKLLKDGWTVVTCDSSLSAQFEHTIGVTCSGSEIFTI